MNSCKIPRSRLGRWLAKGIAIVGGACCPIAAVIYSIDVSRSASNATSMSLLGIAAILILIALTCFHGASICPPEFFMQGLIDHGERLLLSGTGLLSALIIKYIKENMHLLDVLEFGLIFELGPQGLVSLLLTYMLALTTFVFSMTAAMTVGQLLLSLAIRPFTSLCLLFRQNV